jgi:RNA polymerase sigma-70 factor, ECF subfamily
MTTQSEDTTAAVVAAAKAGDEAAFGELADRYRRELQVHCYRMLGSFEDAEDQVQETFLRAWRRRETYEGRSTFRAWLYRIATNACLDSLARRPRPVPPPSAAAAASVPAAPRSEITWLQPYPDRMLEGIAPSDEEPDAVVVAKETIELAFLAAVQHLPPRQRAVLILRDVLGWAAKDTAELLEMSVPSANSALQRARATLKKEMPERRTEWAPGTDPNEQERELVQRYIEASEKGDADGIAALMREDARFSMPPQPEWYAGRDATVRGWIEGGFGADDFGEFRCVPTSANRQPAVACYVKQPGESSYRALAIDVLRIEDGLIAEITAFESRFFPLFGLPPEL